MAISSTTTLTCNHSKIKNNVIAVARQEICDIEYLAKEIDKQSDMRISRILLETAITKVSTVFQLFMKACQYNIQGCSDTEDKVMVELQKKFNDLLSDAKEKTSKNGETSLGKICGHRDKQFHDGGTFSEQIAFYPFAKIIGRGFVGIRVKLGGKLAIENFATYDAVSYEYAFTSEGIYQIENPKSPTESWKHLSFPTITAFDNDETIKEIEGSVIILKKLLHQVESLMQEGDGNNPFVFLNEGGSLELFESRVEDVHVYKLPDKSPFVVSGSLSVRPVSFEINGNSIILKKM